MQSSRLPEDGRLRAYAPAVVLAVIAAGLIAAFSVLARAMVGDPGLSTVDQQITDAVIAARTPGLDYLFWALTLLGNALFLGTVAATAVVSLFLWG